MQTMEQRTLTKDEYDRLSQDYGVNQDYYDVEKLTKEEFDVVRGQFDLIPKHQAMIERTKEYTKTVQQAMDKQFPHDKEVFDRLRKELATKMVYRIDATGQVVRYFPEIDLAIKEADFSALLKDKAFAEKFLVVYKAEDLLSSLK
jgi:hypothetical protein